MPDDRLIFLLSRAHNVLRNHLRERLSAAGVRISAAQAGILFLFKHKDGRTMTELSEALSTDNSAVTGLVDRLENLGCIVRTPCPMDRRAYRIHITPEGLREVGKAKEVIRKVNAEIQEGFSEQEIDAYRKVLMGIFEKFARIAAKAAPSEDAEGGPHGRR